VLVASANWVEDASGCPAEVRVDRACNNVTGVTRGLSLGINRLGEVS
jgi:hypothetical protein